MADPSSSQDQPPEFSEAEVSQTTRVPFALVPALYNENGSQRFGFGDKRAEYRYVRLAREGCRHFIGPMPPKLFIQQFMAKDPAWLKTMPPAAGAFADVPDLVAEQQLARGDRRRKKRRDAAQETSAAPRQTDEGDVDTEEATRHVGHAAKGKGKGKETEPPQEGSKKGGDGKLPAEEQIYLPLITALNGRPPDPDVLGDQGSEPRCPGIAFRDTSAKADTETGVVGSLKPDVSGYTVAHLEAMKSLDTIKAPTHIGLIATFIEVKATVDFFNDPPASSEGDVPGPATHSFVLGHITNESSREWAEKALGQNIAYASELCARQYRHCCFSVSVTGCHARLIRWDRSGAIVTESFNLHKHPEYLCEFYWCFGKMSSFDRGYDLSVEVATQEEQELFRRVVEAHVVAQLAGVTADPKDTHVPGCSLHYEEGVVSTIHLTTPTEDGEPHARKFLVCRPLTAPLSMFGRCTRSYWAVECRFDKSSGMLQGSIAFLKDTWRYSGHTHDVQEGEILEQLTASGVCNIPVVKDHEDVHVVHLDADSGKMVLTEALQSTLTQKFVGASWNCRSDPDVVLLEHNHYRLVLGTVGYPLYRLRGSRELLSATYDAFQALGAADDAGYLHRDISPGNIILVNEVSPVDQSRESSSVAVRSSASPRRGYLCDWDLARHKEHSGLLNDYEVSATWQFQSIDALAHRQLSTHLTYTVEHDMESMLYTVLYCCLCWLPMMAGGDPKACINAMFDDNEVYDGQVVGGSKKAANAVDRRYTRLLQWEDGAVKEWLDHVMDLHSPPGTPATSSDFVTGPGWSKASLDGYWSDFLRRKGVNLPYDNRKMNMTIFKSAERNASLALQGRSYAPPRSYNSSLKHTLEEPDAGSERPRKRRKKALADKSSSSLPENTKGKPERGKSSRARATRGKGGGRGRRPTAPLPASTHAAFRQPSLPAAATGWEDKSRWAPPLESTSSWAPGPEDTENEPSGISGDDSDGARMGTSSQYAGLLTGFQDASPLRGLSTHHHVSQPPRLYAFDFYCPLQPDGLPTSIAPSPPSRSHPSIYGNPASESMGGPSRGTSQGPSSRIRRRSSSETVSFVSDARSLKKPKGK